MIEPKGMSIENQFALARARSGAKKKFPDGHRPRELAHFRKTK
jgi:hypothetical protein